MIDRHAPLPHHPIQSSCPAPLSNITTRVSKTSRQCTQRRLQPRSWAARNRISCQSIVRIMIGEDSELVDPRDKISKTGVRLRKGLPEPDFRRKDVDRLQETEYHVNPLRESWLVKILNLAIQEIKFRKLVWGKERDCTNRILAERLMISWKNRISCQWMVQEVILADGEHHDFY